MNVLNMRPNSKDFLFLLEHPWIILDEFKRPFYECVLFRSVMSNSGQSDR